MNKILICLLLLSSYLTAEMWEFYHFKDHQALIREDFFRTIREKFNIDICIETGTGGGITTKRAARVFHTVHSIEINLWAFLTAQKALRSCKNVSLHKGDSAIILKKILAHAPKDKKYLFFLDAHYNGVPDGKGLTNTPIIQELQTIFSSKLNDPVIIIDDARIFRNKDEQLHEYECYNCDQVLGYPSVAEIVDYIKQHNPKYKVYVYGDLIISYVEDIPVSPVIEFMTHDMIHNNVIRYDLQLAQSRFPTEVTAREEEAIIFMYDSNIFAGPVTYNKFFEMWKCLISPVSSLAASKSNSEKIT